MQTFLPYRRYDYTAKCLDYQRLNSQRSEAMVIYTTIVEGRKGWSNHPAVGMWRGFERELAGYYNTIVEEWMERGYENNMPLLCKSRWHAPSWVTNDLSKSHRSNLMRKNPAWYGQFKWNVPDNLPYVWPR